MLFRSNDKSGIVREYLTESYSRYVRRYIWSFREIDEKVPSFSQSRDFKPTRAVKISPLPGVVDAENYKCHPAKGELQRLAQRTNRTYDVKLVDDAACGDHR